MSINNLSTDLFVLTVNGRQITDFGNTDPAYSEEPIDPQVVLRRGQGGSASRLNRINPGRRVTLNIHPASPDSAFLQGLFNSNANITMTKTMIGTLENAVGTEGVLINDGNMGRAGQSPTDDVFIFEFNRWTGLKGGE